MLCLSCPIDKAAEGPLLADYREHHTDVSVHFDIDLVPGKLASLTASAGGLETKFKLNSKISTGVLPASEYIHLQLYFVH